MHDLALVGFIVALIALGFRRPFLFVLGYAYVDIVSPQRLSYYLLNAVPVSLIFFLLAVGGFVAVEIGAAEQPPGGKRQQAVGERERESVDHRRIP